jgi:hypothetical protein
VTVRLRGESRAPVRDDFDLLASRWWWLPGWAFAAVTQAPALVAMAWLVPGTAMLLAGRLLPLPMVIMFAPLTVALGYFALRRLPVSWPRPGTAALDGDDSGRGPGMPAAAVVAVVAIAAGFGAWQAAFSSQPVFVVSDPGVYLQYGYWIAGHGTVSIPASQSAFGGAAGLDYATTGFTLSGGSLTPAYLPGLPLVLAAGNWLGGLGGALLMPAVLGGCALLSFAGLVGRLCGAWWAVAAELVLAICLPEVYTARTPFSEPLVQVLLFGGLCLFIDSLVVRRRHRAALADLEEAGGLGDGLALAGLGGLALGLTVLASVGSLGLLLPAFPVLAILFVARRPQAAPFAAGLIAGLALGMTVGLVLARAYLATVSVQLHLIGLCAAGFGVATALVAPLAFPGARTGLRRVSAVRPRLPWPGRPAVVLPSLGALLAGLVLALPLLVLAVLALRPYFQVVRGQTDTAVIRQVALLQHLEGLPVDGRRQYYEQSLNWVLWYIGLPAVLLAVAGASVLGHRSVQAALGSLPAAAPPAGVPRDDTDTAAFDLSDDDSAGTASSEAMALWGLPLLIIAWSVTAVLWDPSVPPWQPLAAHRLVPVVVPGLLLLAAWLSSRLTSRASMLGASNIAVVVVGACCVLALAIPPLVTTFNPGFAAKPTVGPYSSGLAKLVSRVELRGVGASPTERGSLAAAAALCTAIGPSSSVLFIDGATAASFAPVVRSLCGQPAAFLPPGPRSQARLGQAVTAIEKSGHRPVVLGPSRTSVALPGAKFRPVISLHTNADAEVLAGPPAGTSQVSYILWLATPRGFAG